MSKNYVSVGKEALVREKEQGGSLHELGDQNPGRSRRTESLAGKL